MRNLLAFLLGVVLTAAAHAASPSSASIDELLAVTKAERLVRGIAANSDAMMRQGVMESLKGIELSAREQSTIDAMIAKFVSAMSDEMAWEKLRPMYVQLYQETFSQEEIEGLLVFYKSPTGQAVIEKMPQVTRGIMAMTQARLTPMMQKFRVITQQTLTEMRAEQGAGEQGGQERPK
jgi:hypothetical protein